MAGRGQNHGLNVDPIGEGHRNVVGAQLPRVLVCRESFKITLYLTMLKEYEINKHPMCVIIIRLIMMLWDRWVP